MENSSREKPGVLVTAKVPILPAFLNMLEERFTVYFFAKVNLTQEVAVQVRAIVGSRAPRDLIDALPNLGMVACTGVGLDKVDMAACRRHGICVSHVPSISRADVADHAILLMLTSFRRICTANHYVRQGLWPAQGDFMLTRKASGKQVGILGLGNIGMCIARRAEAFGCSISYCGRSLKPEVPYTYHDDVTDLAKNSDVMFVACALTEETRHLIDRRVLDALGPEGTLVNIARGSVVNEKDLIEALKEGTLGSAALDVFEIEPVVPQELLLNVDNVVITPHIGSATVDARYRAGQIVIANLDAFFSGKPLVTPALT